MIARFGFLFFSSSSFAIPLSLSHSQIGFFPSLLKHLFNDEWSPLQTKIMQEYNVNKNIEINEILSSGCKSSKMHMHKVYSKVTNNQKL